MQFLRNRWYAAALSDEVSQRGCLARTFLNEPVALFRKPDGTPAALLDQCPHRFAPLSAGQVLNGEIRCAYHGLRFNTSGACIHNPRGDGQIHPRLTVKSYPLLERYGMIWIWLGDVSRIDDDRLPDFEFLDRNEPFRLATGYMHTRAEYEIILDNLLDATHADYLHSTLFCSNGAFETTLPHVEQANDSVAATYESAAYPVQPVFARHLPKPDAPANQCSAFRWIAPAHVRITSEVWQEPAVDRKLWIRSLHTLTPETDRTTHYWFLSSSNAGEATAENLQLRRSALLHAFTTEDKPMLEMVSKRMAGRPFWEMMPHILAGDNATVMMRRSIAALLRRESALDSQRDSPTAQTLST
jgi:phenylpropionate dioxygenase-like ring-hydroxylating dioxygenase large terminal subunit